MPTGEKQRQAEAASPAREDAGPEVTTLLAAAVKGIGGTERTGQVAMAQAVERSIGTGEHLAVQAGTGTGKSLAYLVPAVAHAMATGSSVVVATATIALQRQLIDRDLPRLAAALEPLFGRAPTARSRGHQQDESRDQPATARARARHVHPDFISDAVASTPDPEPGRPERLGAGGDQRSIASTS